MGRIEVAEDPFRGLDNRYVQEHPRPDDPQERERRRGFDVKEGAHGGNCDGCEHEADADNNAPIEFAIREERICEERAAKTSETICNGEYIGGEAQE